MEEVAPPQSFDTCPFFEEAWFPQGHMQLVWLLSSWVIQIVLFFTLYASFPRISLFWIVVPSTLGGIFGAFRGLSKNLIGSILLQFFLFLWTDQFKFLLQVENLFFVFSISLFALGTTWLGVLCRRANQSVRTLRAEQDKLYQMATAVHFAGDCIEITDTEGRYVYVNPAFEEMMGYSKEEALGRTPAELLRSHFESASFYDDVWDTITGGDVWSGEMISQCKGGELRTFSMTISPVRNPDGDICNLLAIRRDITEQKEHEERLKHEALHDVLTGLPNRQLLYDRITQGLHRLQRYPKRTFAVLFLDLDRFKHINDNFGHAVGDALLLECSQRLLNSVRAEDTVARLGGDEFVILLEHISEREGAIEVAQRIHLALQAPFCIEDKEHTVTSSIGIVMHKEGYTSPEELIRDADNAMYQAKELGRNQYAIFKSGSFASVSEQLKIEKELYAAIQNNEFVLYYQPLIRVEDQSICGLEALLRWMHPTRGILTPEHFIEIAENTGLIVQIGRWVLEEVGQHIGQWQELLNEPFHIPISINISAHQCIEPLFVEELLGVLKHFSIPPSLLKLDITERVLIHDFQSSASSLSILQKAGVQIAMDDFGTGYSSLSYLYQFPFDTIKIDQSFVARMKQGTRAYELIRTCIILAHQFGMTVVAEGVDTLDKFEALSGFGCDAVQGYWFSPPLADTNVLSFLSSFNKQHSSLIAS